MSTTDGDLLKVGGELSERDEKARRAVKVFRAMLPGLSAYARAITGDPKTSVKMVKKGVSSAYTDGKTIFIIPPIDLGNLREHNRSLCDSRSESGRQRCEACAIVENVLGMIYHELAHVCFDSFTPLRERDKVDMTRRAMEEAGTKFAKTVLAKYNAAPVYAQNSYTAVAAMISPFLQLIFNGLEDARVNQRMFEAREGVRPMMEAMNKQTFTEGVRQADNSVVMWSEYPVNLQAIIGCFLKASGYDYAGWLHPKVEDDLDDPTLDALSADVIHAKSAADIYNLSFKFLTRLRELGYCKSDIDPEDDEEESEDGTAQEEPAEQDDPEDQGGDDADPSDSGDDGEENADGSGGEADPEGSGDPEAGGADRPDDESAPESEPDGQGDAGDGADAGDGEGSAEGPEDEAPGSAPGEGGSEGTGTPDDDGAEVEPDGSGGGADSGPSGDADDVDDTPGGGQGAAADDGDASGDAADAPEQDGAGGDGSAQGAGSSGEHDEEVGAGPDDPSDDEGVSEGSADQQDREGDVDPTAGGAGGGQADPGGEQSSDPDTGAGSAVGSGSDASESNLGDGPGDGERNGAEDAGEPDADRRPDPDVEVDGGLTDGEASDQGAGPTGDDAGQPGEDGAPDDVSDGGHEGGEGGDPAEAEALPEHRPDPSAGEDGPGGDDSGESDDFGSPDDAGDGFSDEDVFDTGAAEEGISVEFGPDVEYGDAEDLEPFLAKFLGHDEHATTGPEAREEQANADAMVKAILQGDYFETPSSNIYGVREYRYGDPDMQGRSAHAWTNKRRYSSEHHDELGLVGDIEAPESILGPALLRMRRAFGDNERRSDTLHLKAGRVNTRALGKRAPLGDPRLFKKRSHPGKRDYVVEIGMDISASNAGMNLLLLKRAVVAQATLLHRMGIPFSVVAHSGHFHDEVRKYKGGLDLEIYHIKDLDEPWGPKIVERLFNLAWDSANLDGHALEYLRKQIEKERATDKIILYYSDGKMPAENHDEELEILRREIRLCKQKGIHLLGVGIRTDSPREHGLDTVQVDDYADIRRVVEHLERRLLAV